jgi:Domain of unknown function (DUF4338)
MSPSEGSVLWQGNREVCAEDIAYIRTLIQRFPRLARSELADTLCEHLGWLTPAGAPKKEACRKLLARLEAAGEIGLPARRKQGGDQTSGRQHAATPSVPIVSGEPLQCSLAQLGPVRLRLLGHARDVAQCNAHLERFHPLGYHKPFGYWGRYRIEAADRSLGYLLLCGPARAIEPRDRWIGWSARQRLSNLPWVVNNSRFLILPWVQVEHLASHVLGQLARQLADDWRACWGYRPLLLESFVDPVHYRGTCYRAAGWDLLGHTSGRGLARPGKHYRSAPKLIFVKPLQGQFRRLLCSEQLHGRHEP